MKEPITVSPKIYGFTFIALLLLLAVSFGIAHLRLGPWGVVAGVAIAAIKALLVALYFMHIRYTSGFLRVAAAAGVFWLGVLIVLTLSDYLSRGWLLLPSHWPG